MALSDTLNRHSQCYEAQVSFTQECREKLMWWDTHLINWNGKSLLKKEVDMIIHSDASLIRWGATCQSQQTGGPWSLTESNRHVHKLPGVAGCNIASPDIPERQNQNVSTPPVGQHHSTSTILEERSPRNW